MSDMRQRRAYMIGNGIGGDRCVQNISYVRFLWCIWRVLVCSVQNSIRPRGCPFVADSTSGYAMNYEQPSRIPVLIILPKMIFVTAFKFPEFAFAKAYEDSAFATFNEKLVELSHFSPKALISHCRWKVWPRDYTRERVWCWN